MSCNPLFPKTFSGRVSLSFEPSTTENGHYPFEPSTTEDCHSIFTTSAHGVLVPRYFNTTGLGVCLVIINEWPPLSHRLLWFG